VQIDAPEVGECYARRAREELGRLAPVGSRVSLEADAGLDDVDRFGRLLRYVLREDVNVNVELVRRGAAVPFFFRWDRGRYAAEIEAAAREARTAGRGLWSCPRPG
jgi:endonuclease YncB( thermonuclease family)